MIKNPFLTLWAEVFGIVLDGDEVERLHYHYSNYGTHAWMDKLINSLPSLWSWRVAGPGHIKIVQSWINRPTRSEWSELKCTLIDTVIPYGIYVEFLGCPKREQHA